jgi:hypothetical protein
MTSERYNKIKSVIESLFDEMNKAEQKHEDTYFTEIADKLYDHTPDKHFIAVVLDTIYYWDMCDFICSFDMEYVADIIERYYAAEQLYEKYNYTSDNTYLDTYNALDKDNDFITFDMIETIFTIIEIIQHEIEHSYVKNVQYKIIDKWIWYRDHLDVCNAFKFIDCCDKNISVKEMYSSPAVKNLIGHIRKYWLQK